MAIAGNNKLKPEQVDDRHNTVVGKTMMIQPRRTIPGAMTDYLPAPNQILITRIRLPASDAYRAQVISTRRDSTTNMK